VTQNENDYIWVKAKSMFVFENGPDSARMDDKKVITNFSLKIDKMEDAYLVHIPAFNIHFYTKTEDEIEKSAHESLVSFFKYWIKEQGIDKLHSHMLSLGFSIKSISDKPIKRPGNSKMKFIADDELVIL